MNKKMKIIILVLVVFVLGAALINAALSNKKVLFSIALASDDPSSVRYFALERIYKLSQKESFRKELLEQLIRNEQPSLQGLLIRTIGVAGEREAAGYLMKAYVDTQDDKSRRRLQHYIVDSMGLIGNDGIVRLLEKLLENYERHPIEATQYAIARALYLQTGEKYYYIDSFGKRVTITISDELLKARDVILKTKDRERTVQEMILLDKLFRPPAIRETSGTSTSIKGNRGETEGETE